MSTTSPERHATLLKAAARAARNIVTILDPEELFRRTVDIICDEFGFYYAGVFLLDETGQYAVLHSGRGAAGAAMLAEGHKLAVGGNSMIGASVQNRQGRIALDVGTEAVFFENPHLPKTRSEMALPLIVGDDVIGALTVQSTEAAAFHDEDIAALQTMVDQLAVAIENSRTHRTNQNLLRQAERRLRLLQASNKVGKEVTSILVLDILLPQTVDIICEAYGFYYAGVFLVDEVGEFAVLRAGHGEAGAAMLEEGYKLKIGSNSMIGAAIAFGEARIALDVGEERVHFKNPHLPHTRSEMALPLTYGGKVLGALTIQSMEERAFSQDDITTLLTMAEHLAVAINNARAVIDLSEAHAEILRNRVFEALTMATTEAIHWIGNKTLPISMIVERLQAELADGKIDPASLQEDLEMISESAEQIIEVKEQLIGAVREVRPRPVMLADVLETVVHQHGIAEDLLQVDIAPEAAYVIADSTQLTRAFGNMIQNAVDAGAKSVNVSAHLIEEPGILEIIIEDDGAGMSEEVQRKAWSPFFSTRGGEHHGLGLPAAMHVISQVQGRIALVSEEGNGTTVAVYISQGKISDAAPEMGKISTVLLVDNDDAWSKQFAESLAKMGVKLTRSTDAKKISAADLILIDEHCTSVDMDAVLETITKSKLLARTVVLTTAINPERVTYFLHAGVRDVQLKPYTQAEIATLVS
jgi:GAF domain-containing protein/anti-sigma regulatory factor (Ser/Thr protein kinase)